MKCFKAYDIRGRVPADLDEDIAYRIGRAYAAFIKPKSVIVGRDVRLSGASISSALSKGLLDAGADVLDIGVCGTEEVYFAVFHKNTDGGIMVTASHNPGNYNGMKLVGHGSRPISGDSGLKTIERLAEEGDFSAATEKGHVNSIENRDAYIDHLLTYIDVGHLKRLKLVVNSGNGSAGPVIDMLSSRLPFDLIRINHEPDGTFPNGVPNPLLPENRSATKKAVIRHSSDMGVAWDGDFDRCFIFDEHGRFIEGYYIVGLLAEARLEAHPGSKIIHDPRLIWNTVELVRRHGGLPVQSKTGHAFIKERMRQEDAVYGGEMSAHHYFREFAYCDSGMVPWLLIAEIICRRGKTLSGLIDERIQLYPSSGEINREISDTARAISAVKAAYEREAISIDYTDGLSMEFPKWRFNIRMSNTEPLVRLNVESRADQDLLRTKTEEVLRIIDKPED